MNPIANFARYKDVPAECWQYDYGQRIQLIGDDIAAGQSVQWSYGSLAGVDSRVVVADGDLFYAEIPDAALAQSGAVTGYVYVFDALAGYTVYSILLTVTARAATTEQASTDQVPQWQQLLLDAEQAIDDADTATGLATGAAGTANTAADNADTATLAANQAAADAVEAVEGIQGVEADRVIAEQGRASAEGGRVSAESARVTAEGNASSGRVKAEADRVTAEGLRVTAEQGRATLYTEVTNARGGQVNLDTRLDGFDTQLAQTASLAQLNEKTSYGVVSGLGVTQQTVPDMTVKVAAGVIWMAAGTRFAPSAVASQAVTAADATNPRIDIVYVNSSGVITYLAGTAAATPAQPATPVGGQLLATILVTAGKTSIVTADITARRKNMWTEDWITPTLLNGAVQTDVANYPVGYFKDAMGFVYLRGSIGVIAGYTVVMNLAAGYRPGKFARFVCAADSTNYGYILINPNGDLRIDKSGTSLTNLSGIVFRAEY